MRSIKERLAFTLKNLFLVLCKNNQIEDGYQWQMLLLTP